MRENTERPIIVDVSTNVLVGTNRPALLHAIESILDNTFKRGAIPDLWDGHVHAAARIMDILRAQLGLPARP
jgi:UDP-N-acetylglucosamine 2-epimerase (non-hydrolysing)